MASKLNKYVVNTRPEQERRFKILHVGTHDMLGTLCLNATVPHDCVTKLSVDNVPEGTEILDRWYDCSLQCECLLLWNKDWPSVTDGEFAPRLERPRLSVVVVNLNKPRTPEECTQPLSRQPGVEPLPEAQWEPPQPGSIAWSNWKVYEMGTAPQREYISYMVARRTKVTNRRWWCFTFEAWLRLRKPLHDSRAHDGEQDLREVFAYRQEEKGPDTSFAIHVMDGSGRLNMLQWTSEHPIQGAKEFQSWAVGDKRPVGEYVPEVWSNQAISLLDSQGPRAADHLDMTLGVNFKDPQPPVKGIAIHADGSAEFFDTSKPNEDRPWAWQAGLPNPVNPPTMKLNARGQVVGSTGKGFSEAAAAMTQELVDKFTAPISDEDWEEDREAQAFMEWSRRQFAAGAVTVGTAAWKKVRCPELIDTMLKDRFCDVDASKLRQLGMTEMTTRWLLGKAGVPPETIDAVFDQSKDLSRRIENFNNRVEPEFPDSNLVLNQGPPVYGGLLEGMNTCVDDVHKARELTGQPKITDEEAQRQINNFKLPEQILKVPYEVAKRALEARDPFSRSWTEEDGTKVTLPSPEATGPGEFCVKRTVEKPTQETWRDKPPML